MDHVHVHDNLLDVRIAGVNDWVREAVTRWNWGSCAVRVVLTNVVVAPQSVEALRRSPLSGIGERWPITCPVMVWVVVGVRRNSRSGLNPEPEFVGWIVVVTIHRHTANSIAVVVVVLLVVHNVVDEVVVVRILVGTTWVVLVTIQVAIPNSCTTASTIVGTDMAATCCWIGCAVWIVTRHSWVRDVD